MLQEIRDGLFQVQQQVNQQGQQLAGNMQQPFQKLNNNNTNGNGGNCNNYNNRNGGNFSNNGNMHGNSNRNGGGYGNSRNDNGNNNGNTNSRYNGNGNDGGGGNDLNFEKRFENNNYCHTCGHDLPQWHTIKTCDRPLMGHQYNASCKNTMGGSKKAAHKNSMPSAVGKV